MRGYIFLKFFEITHRLKERSEFALFRNRILQGISWLVQRPYLVVISGIIITIFLSLSILKIKIDNDIKNFIDDDSAKVFAFSVADKFGDSGITGLCIIIFNDKNQTAVIDTFLMSCRIIGRNIEYAFIDYLVDIMKRNNINKIRARYIKTQKNGQVKTFYDKCSFRLTDSNESVRNYTLVVSEYKPRLVNYIEVLDGKQFG